MHSPSADGVAPHLGEIRASVEQAAVPVTFQASSSHASVCEGSSVAAICAGDPVVSDNVETSQTTPASCPEGGGTGSGAQLATSATKATRNLLIERIDELRIIPVVIDVATLLSSLQVKLIEDIPVTPSCGVT